MNILSINTSDRAGGAEKIAYELFNSYRELGYRSNLYVGKKNIDDNNIFEIPNNRNRNVWARLWRTKQEDYAARQTRIKARLAGWLANLGEMKRWIDWQRGVEDFNYPGTQSVLDQLLIKPDVIHIHNLHGGYFNLNILSSVSHNIPCVITLHDEWTYTGHCAYTLGCDRWETGCGNCPHLNTYPAIKRDRTNYNWRRKHSIYSNSRLYVAAPSRWLLDRATRSVLGKSVAGSKLIPYGIDLKIFKPGTKASARKQLNLPIDAKIALFVANKTTTNPFKDFATIESTITRVASSCNDQNILFLCLGEDLPERQINNATIRFVPYQIDPAKVALLYQSSDVYLHAAKIDNYPLAIIEALACGLPVIATAVGGISEMINDGRDGFLIPLENSEMMAMRTLQILNDTNMTSQMSSYAAVNAKIKYDLRRHAQDYLTWYEEIISNHDCI